MANQKAVYLYKKLNTIVKDKEHVTPFEFQNKGTLAYLGDWCVITFLQSRSFELPNADTEKKNNIGKPSTTVVRLRAAHKPRKQAESPGCCGARPISP